MNWKHWFTVAVLLLLPGNSMETFAQVPKAQPRPTRIIRNRDVLQMVRSGMKSHLIIANILTSPCNFDIFPPVLDDLKRRGVPENVLHVMSVVPNGPPNLPEANGTNATPPIQISKVTMPKGLPVTVETLYPVSSKDLKLNGTIAFSVVSPILIDGVLAIPRGTIARAKIVRLKKAGMWGRGGALTFEMEQIVAIDGTRIPVQLTAAADGENRAGVLAVGAAATSALVFPYTAPVAIVWGLKKGDDAVVRGNKEFSAVIASDTEVTGLVPVKDRVIYHSSEALKVKQSSAPAAFPRLGVRN